jgi:dTDP-4-amino-4,6-dideoxygalactose transaminase
VGTWGPAGAFSFYPTKNLGALGDGGAIVTNDATLAGKLRRLRNGGQTSRYHHTEFGVNSRLDEMQAAVLRARLRRLAGWTATRRALASRYRANLKDADVRVPPELDAGHVYHLFPILTAGRDALQARLASAGIETLIHYPLAISAQQAMSTVSPAACPIAARAAAEVLSLPLHPGMTTEAIDYVSRHVAG